MAIEIGSEEPKLRFIQEPAEWQVEMRQPPQARVDFGTDEAVNVLTADKRNPFWMAGVEDYGGTAPMPERDDAGHRIGALRQRGVEE